MLKHRGCVPPEGDLQEWCCPADGARKGRQGVLRLILDEGYQINEVGKNNRTLLHIAAHGGHREVALLLIDRGADMSAEMEDGRTPLHLASNGEVKSLFLAKRANLFT